MTNDQEKKGYFLVENAFSYPGFLERKGDSESFRLWVYPSFDPFISFTLSKFRDGYFLRRIVWDQRKQTLTDEPQTYCAELEVEKSVFTELRSSLAEICVAPFKPAEMLGIDGTRFGVTKRQFMSETTLHWWECYPEEWLSLREWHSKYLLKLAGLFDSSPVDISKALTKLSN